MPSPVPILDAELLRAFVAFADTLNFTRAARLVHLSQPALFERVRRLSERLEVRLYERAGRSVRLTEAGSSLAAFARETLSRSETFVRELRGEARHETVTLAAGEGSWLYCLGPAVARFTERGVGALRPLTLGAQAAAEAVRSGQADLAFTVLDVVPSGLVSEEVLRVPMCAALPARHRLARAPRLQLDALATERLVLPPAGRFYRDLVARFVAKSGAELAAPIEADGWPLMLAFVRAGLGVAVVNGTCVAPPGVRLRPLPELGTVTYRLIQRRGGELSPTARLLVEELRGLRSGAATGRG